MSLRSISFISYAMHTVVAVAAVLPGVQASVVLLLVAMVIDLVNLERAKGSWHESHYRYRLRTVMIAGLSYAATAPLWLLFLVPGWAAWTLISLWFAYRVIKGFARLNNEATI